MSTSAIVETLTVESCRAADQAAADATQLVSITIDMIKPGTPISVEARADRKTRTLLFMSADAYGADGKRLATATSVHKIAPR